MTREEFSKLQPGDLVQVKDTSYVYVITGHTRRGHPRGVRPTTFMLPEELSKLDFFSALPDHLQDSTERIARDTRRLSYVQRTETAYVDFLKGVLWEMLATLP